MDNFLPAEDTKGSKLHGFKHTVTDKEIPGALRDRCQITGSYKPAKVQLF